MTNKYEILYQGVIYLDAEDVIDAQEQGERLMHESEVLIALRKVGTIRK